MLLVRARRIAVGLGAIGLSGCGTVGTAVAPASSHRLVLIPASRSRPSEADLARGARTEARGLGYRLTVQAPATASAAGQIAIIDAVIAAKPAAVVIQPDGGRALAAPLQSLRSAGTAVALLGADVRRPRQAGARAVRDAVGELLRQPG